MSPTHNPETKLALRARNDGEALAELIVECSSSVKAFIYKKMNGRSVEDREDMFQVIMLCLCCNIGNFKGKSSFFSWFRRIQINKIAGYYRKDSRNSVFLMEDPTDWPDDITKPSYYDPYDNYKELLPQRHHHYLDTIYDTSVNGYLLSEIAERDNESYEAVRSRYRRGTVALEEDLEKCGIRRGDSYE